MTTPETTIEKFFDTRADSVSPHTYFVFGYETNFKYIFSKTSIGSKIVADRLTGATLKEQLGTAVFQAGGISPSFLRFVPGVTTTSVSVPDPAAFDCAIVSGNNITLISPQNGIVTKLKSYDKEYFGDEFETQRSLPDIVNHPNVIDLDESHPYFIQEYIDGRKVTDVRKDWPYILDGLTQLSQWAAEQGVDWIPMDEARETLRYNLKIDRKNGVVGQACKELNEYSLPEHIAVGPTHGDFTFDNLRVSGEEVYIIDWGSKTDSYLIRDFLFIFLHWHCYSQNDEKFFYDLLSQPSGGTIGQEYAKAIGPFAWDSSEWYPGLVLFGLLYELTQRSWEHERSKEIRRLLRLLLK